MTDTEPAPPAWLPLASRALTEAVLGNSDAAGEALADLHNDHGAEAIPAAMIAWIDTLLAARPPQSPHAIISPAFVNLHTGTINLNSRDVPPATAFTGQLIAARANNDHDMAQALLDSAPTDEQYAHNVCTLLHIIAANLRMAGWHHTLAGDTDD